MFVIVLVLVIMADKCTDIANKEQGEDLQYFTGLYQVESINANCLVFAIKDALLLMEHQLSSWLASAMMVHPTWVITGMVWQLRSAQKRNLCTLLWNALNLAFGELSNMQSKLCHKALARKTFWGEQAHHLFSHKQCCLRSNQVRTQWRRHWIGIHTSCPTRWTVWGIQLAGSWKTMTAWISFGKNA